VVHLGETVSRARATAARAVAGSGRLLAGGRLARALRWTSAEGTAMSGMRWVVGALVGAAAGYAWYRLVGCASGACPITARWWTSTLYGAAMGGLLGGSGPG
jgi:hypothetical protein